MPQISAKMSDWYTSSSDAFTTLTPVFHGSPTAHEVAAAAAAPAGAVAAAAAAAAAAAGAAAAAAVVVSRRAMSGNIGRCLCLIATSFKCCRWGSTGCRVRALSLSEPRGPAHHNAWPACIPDNVLTEEKFHEQSVITTKVSAAYVLKRDSATDITITQMFITLAIMLEVY